MLSWEELHHYHRLLEAKQRACDRSNINTSDGALQSVGKQPHKLRTGRKGTKSHLRCHALQFNHRFEAGNTPVVRGVLAGIGNGHGW